MSTYVEGVYEIVYQDGRKFIHNYFNVESVGDDGLVAKEISPKLKTTITKTKGKFVEKRERYVEATDIEAEAKEYKKRKSLVIHKDAVVASQWTLPNETEGLTISSPKGIYLTQIQQCIYESRDKHGYSLFYMDVIKNFKPNKTNKKLTKELSLKNAIAIEMYHEEETENLKTINMIMPCVDKKDLICKVDEPNNSLIFNIDTKNIPKKYKDILDEDSYNKVVVGLGDKYDIHTSTVELQYGVLTITVKTKEEKFNTIEIG